MSKDRLETALQMAAAAIAAADALVISAGAGMGVDSGLPDFRGSAGFWKAYPAFAKLGLQFEQLANPRWFEHDPQLAWGFYGHRLNLYQATTPHAGFGLLLHWARSKPGGYFVFTSNIDGHFQRAGFDELRVVECHGALGFLQCTIPCSRTIWSIEDWPHPITVREETMRADPPLPECPQCGMLSRPNVLMFGDGRFVDDRATAQEDRYINWLKSLGDARLVVIECGAGTAVPTVRQESQRLVLRHEATLVRINLREPHIQSGQIALPLTSLAALHEINRRLEQMPR